MELWEGNHVPPPLLGEELLELLELAELFATLATLCALAPALPVPMLPCDPPSDPCDPLPNDIVTTDLLEPGGGEHAVQSALHVCPTGQSIPDAISHASLPFLMPSPQMATMEETHIGGVTASLPGVAPLPG